MKPLDLSVEPLFDFFEPLRLYISWNLFKCEMFMWSLGNLKLHVEPLWKLEPLWNLESLRCGTFTRNLGESEPLWSLEPFKCGTLMWNPGEPKPGSFGTLERPGSFTWNPYLEPRNLPEPSLRTLGCLEPSLNLLLGTLEACGGTLAWNLGTFRFQNVCLGVGTSRNLAG